LKIGNSFQINVDQIVGIHKKTLDRTMLNNKNRKVDWNVGM